MNPFGIFKYILILAPAAIFCFGILPLIGIVWFLIATRTFTWRLKFLYFLTIMLELPGVFIRFFICLLFLPVVVIPFYLVAVIPVSIGILIGGLLKGDSWATINLASSQISITLYLLCLLIVGIIWTFMGSWGPPVMSFLNLLGWPSGLWITRLSLGAYAPSQRQREWYGKACDLIKARSHTPFTFPNDVYMLERTDDFITTIGKNMFISQELMRREYFPTLLAAELYWYNSGASRVVLSLRRLSVDVMFLLSRAVGTIAPGNIAAALAGGEAIDRYLANVFTWLLNLALAIAGGGVGIFLLLPFWQLYGRSETYKADDFAADLGFCIELKNYLDMKTRVPILLPIPYFMSPEPFTELRHDKLNQRCSGVAMPHRPSDEELVKNLVKR